jgi:hypothetical protein
MADILYKVLYGPLKKLVDMLDGTYAELQIAQPPAFLLSGTTKQRLRVDVGEPGFFQGQQARTFREFSINTGSTLTLKVVVPLNIILLQQGVDLDSGSLRVTNAVGGTPAGSFAAVRHYCWRIRLWVHASRYSSRGFDGNRSSKHGRQYRW